MALVLKDRVRQTSTTAGYGTLTLSGSVTGYQNFSVIGSGNTTYYTITDAAGNWEVGLGTYTSPNQLSRDTVYESSNANALVNFSSASKDVFVTFPAEGFSSPPAIGDTTPNTIKGTFVSGNAFTAIVSSQTGNALNSAINTTYGTVKVLPPTGAIPKIEFDGTPEGYEKLTIDVDTYFTGISFTATGAYGSVFYSPITFVDTTTNNDGVTVAAAAGSTSYNLSLPPTSGSANQILKTDGSGNLDWMDLGSPPAIGGTTPNAITGTTITAADLVGGSPPSIVVNDAINSGVTATINIDPATYGVAISATDGLTNYPLQCDAGLYLRNSYPLIMGNATSNLSIYVPASFGSYNLTFPTTPGSANQVLKTDGSGNLDWITQGVQGTAPVTVTAATYTVAATDQWIIGNRSGTITMTLPTASSNVGRSINVKTITANTMVSASSNVVPLAGGAASTAILAATAGKFATLVSDGTNWIIMAGN